MTVAGRDLEVVDVTIDVIERDAPLVRWPCGATPMCLKRFIAGLKRWESWRQRSP